MENRNLQQAPQWSLKRLMEGKWTKEFEAYTADQFAGRAGWVQAKVTAERVMGRSDTGGVYWGKNSRLFEKRDMPQAGRLQQNLTAMAAFADWADGEGITVSFLPAYSAYAIYPEELPAYAEVFDEKKAMQQAEEVLREKMVMIDPLDKLVKHKGENIYFLTDHHWTQDGARIAYETWAEKMGFQPTGRLREVKSRQPFYGSLYSKAPLPWQQPDELRVWVDDEAQMQMQIPETKERIEGVYRWENLEKKDQYTVFLGGNYAQVKITTSANTNRKLLVFKDSFAHALVPLLARHYDEIDVVDLRYFKQPVREYVKAQGITDVLFAYNLSWMADDPYIPAIQY